MSKRSATILETNNESSVKKRKLCIEQTFSSSNIKEQSTTPALSTNDDSNNNINKLTNTRESFLQSQRKWIQYPKHINNQIKWNTYSQHMENIYNCSFPDLNEFKIGNLITFRKNSQFEFMSGIIIRGPNTNQSSIYSNSNKQICIKLLSDALSTQTINNELCSINKSKLNTFKLINNETDIYSLIPKQTFEFEYSDTKDNNNNFLFTEQNKNNKNKRKIHKKAMKFDKEIILLNINEYEIFEHREIVWSQIEGFEWHPSQILFKWKYGERISPSMAKQQFGLLYVVVAFFDVHQTSKIRLSQRHLIPFNNEPSLDIINRSKKDYKKFNILNNSIHNAIILGTLQKRINYKLHYMYHNNIHIKNVWRLRNLCVPKYDWIAQKVFILNEKEKIWMSGRIMYYSEVLNKHFIEYDDHGHVEWIDIYDNHISIDWCDDGYNKDNYDGNDNTIHDIREIHGYGVDECTTNKVAISTRLIGGIYRNCNKCWICNESVVMNLNEIECIHCICCRRRVHLNCLKKSGVNQNILINHLLSVYCDECRNCHLCKKQLPPHNIIEWTLNIFDINKFVSNCFTNKNSLYNQSIKQCNLCKRHFHKQCLPIDNNKKSNINAVPNSSNENNSNVMEKWLCFECRICRCCNSKISNGQWYDGYTLCFKCYINQNKTCKICYKNNWNDIVHEPFLIECHKCNDNIHLSCSPYKLDEISIMKLKNNKINFICYFCMEKSIQKMQLNVIEILIKNDKAGIVIRNIDSILVLRSYILSTRVTLLHFINVFKRIWNSNKYEKNIVDKMMDYLCEIVAKLFNHFCLKSIESMEKKCMNIIRKDNNNNVMGINECVYYSSNESLLLADKCVCCGSCEDKDKLIICKRCSISVHSYCVRSNIDFKISDNSGYCYDCLWYYYKNNKLNKIGKSIKLINGNNSNNSNNRLEEVWKLEGIYLKELYELYENDKLNENSFNEFIFKYNIPLYIKPLLCNIIKDIQKCDNKLNRLSTKKLSANELNDPVGKTPTLEELSIKENEYKSELYVSLNNKDNKKILNDNRKCELCKYHLNDLYNESKVCGRLLPVQQLVNNGNENKENDNEYECKWIHTKCALSSTDYTVEYFNNYGTNIININMTNVLYICKEYKCHICNQFGASLHCSISDCTFSYHYPCIITTQMYDNWNYNSRPFFCNMHKIHYNNNKNMINSIRNKQNLYDKCCINLYNDYTQLFNGNDKNKNECFKVKGNVIFKTLKDRNNNVILYQIYDMFWSYCNIGKRTQFIYETYKCNKYKYKLIVSDDPMSYQIFNGNDSKEILQKLIQKYPNGVDKSLFDQKHSFFL